MTFKKNHKINIGRKHSEESKIKISLANKGYKHSEETKIKMKASEERREKQRNRMIGNQLWRKRKHSEETKIKISNNHARYWKGKKLSEEHKQKISGKVPWNKGLTKKDNPDKITYGVSGKDNPTKRPEVRKKISIANSNPSIETRNKIRQTLKTYYKEHPELIEVFKKRMRYVIIPKIDSSIEVKIQNFLTALKIEFVTHKYMNIKNSYQCDLFVPSMNLIIEADGDLFHMNPNRFSPEYQIFGKGMKAKERWKLDSNRTKQLISKGYNVIRIWENEIKKMKLEDFKEKIMEVKK